MSIRFHSVPINVPALSILLIHIIALVLYRITRHLLILNKNEIEEEEMKVRTHHRLQSRGPPALLASLLPPVPRERLKPTGPAPCKDSNSSVAEQPRADAERSAWPWR